MSLVWDTDVLWCARHFSVYKKIRNHFGISILLIFNLQFLASCRWLNDYCNAWEIETHSQEDVKDRFLLSLSLTNNTEKKAQDYFIHSQFNWLPKQEMVIVYQLQVTRVTSTMISFTFISIFFCLVIQVLFVISFLFAFMSANYKQAKYIKNLCSREFLLFFNQDNNFINPIKQSAVKFW